MIPRTYTKLYNKKDSKYTNEEKILLGYQTQTTELVLGKDEVTFFHMPFFAQTQPLSASTLIADGAIGGPIPAMADRVMRFRGGYGKNTPWGNETEEVLDGVWYCSWLYEDPQNGSLQWVDRVYNPGRLQFNEDLEGETDDLNQGGYLPNGEIYRDVPSRMLFLSGNYYQYFHVGEKKLADNVATFDGDNRKTLSIHFSGGKLQSSYPILTSGPVLLQTESSLDLIDKTYLDLWTQPVDVSVPYQASYNTPEEFTMSFWFRHPNWEEATFSLMGGNFNNGGFGVLYNNQKGSFNWVLPETTFGHLLYFNAEGNCYLDQTSRIQEGETTTPQFLFTNDLGETWVLSETNNQLSLYKADYNGITNRTSRYGNGNSFSFQTGENCNAAKLDKNQNLTVVTNLSSYVFDRDLLLQSVSLSSSRVPYLNAAGGISFSSGQQAQLIQGVVWSVRNGVLYRGSVVSSLSSLDVEKILEGPDGNLWVLHDEEYLSAFHPETLESLIEISNLGEPGDSRSFSFQNYYHPIKKKHFWRVIVLSSKKKLVYYFTLLGNIEEVRPLDGFIDYSKAPADEDSTQYSMILNPLSDWTGYEFKKAQNYTGLEFVLSTTDYRMPRTVFNRTERVLIPLSLANREWYHFLIQSRNKQLSFYVNGDLALTYALSPNVDITYTQKNNFYYGTFPGKNTDLRSELATNSLIFNGHLGDLGIYNYAIQEMFIPRFFLSQWKCQDIVWNIPTTQLGFIEEIDKFYQQKLPLSKAKGFKIHLIGHGVNDPALKALIETYFKEKIRSQQPSYSDLLHLEWH